MSLDVGQWLDELNLGRYRQVFAAHGIKHPDLPFLTDAHLLAMGLPIGVRLDLLDAVHRSTAAEEMVDMAIERRHMTVMFVDLVGSTALSARLDPEDLRDAIRAFHHAVGVEVACFQAYVAQYKGDGALVYFGYPRAQEDDALNAVRAGLNIVRTVSKVRMAAAGALAAHIGIATGLAVVGDTFGHTRARERSAIGEMPNLAARLVDLAGSGEVVVSHQTFLLVRQDFAMHELGAQMLKGLPSPIQAYRVAGCVAVPTRFDARHRGALREMVGRRRELSQLLWHWHLSSQGSSQTVVVEGEAGIGKSRLVRALMQSIDDGHRAQIVMQCSPSHTGDALFPFVQQIALTAGLQADDDPVLQMERLEAVLSGFDAIEIALIASLVGLSAQVRLPQDMAPAQRRHRTFQAVAGYVKRMAGDRPLLWLLEDVHWIDPSSLELMDQFIARAGSMRLMVVVTSRPDFEHRSLMMADLGFVKLQRLEPDEVDALVSSVCHGQAVTPMAVARIAAHTDGVPLFVEEFTKSLLDGNALVSQGGIYDLIDVERPSTVPVSLQGTLMARLDRRHMLREVAQIASCIGREFDRELLFRIAGLSKITLDTALTELQVAELVFPSVGVRGDQFAFKHALVRDAAYESLLKRRREELHASILGELEGRAGVAMELLARHAAGASLNARAAEMWVKAGLQAMARNAFGEAVTDIKQALKLSEGIASPSQRLDMLLMLGQAMIPWRGYSHSDSVRVFSEAHELSCQLGDALRTFWVAYARWLVHYVRGEHGTAHDVAHGMLVQAREEAHSGRTLAALRCLGISQMIGGDPNAADVTFARAETLADKVRDLAPERRLAVAQRFAADPEISTQFHRALTHWSLGRFDLARRLAEEAIQAARAMGHVHTLGHALTHGAILAVVERDTERAFALCEETVAFAQHHDMELWQGYGSLLQGHALVLRGQCAEGSALLQMGMKRLARTETGTMLPVHHAVCAWSLASQARFEEARPHELAVHAELSRGSERYFWVDCLIWLARVRGLDPQSAPGDVEQLLDRALTEARRQKALAWELRAATALGMFWLSHGDADRGRRVVELLLMRLPQERRSNLRHEAEMFLGVQAVG